MLNTLLKKFFGDKNERSTRDLWPIVDQINSIYETLKDLSDEELRNKTVEFKQKIQDETAETRNRLEDLKTKLHEVQSADEKHSIYDEIEGLEKELDEKYQEILDEILPEAFAVVKDTCRRLVGKSWDVA